MKTAAYRLSQGDRIMARCDGPEQYAKAHIKYYATIYGQDGAVKIEKFVNGRWRKCPLWLTAIQEM
jgi:hypothetical protein